MRIALASGDINLAGGSGGIATYTHHLAQGLQERGHSVTVLGAGDVYSHEIKLNGVKYIYLPSRNLPFRIRRLRSIADVLHRSRALSTFLTSHQEFDVVEFPVWNAESLSFKNRGAVKTVVRGHTPHAIVNALVAESGLKVAKADVVLEKLEAIAVRNADLFLANSKASLETSLKTFKLDRKKASVCYHGILMPSRLKMSIASSNVEVLFVGRLEPRKGIDYLLEAFSKIQSLHPQVKLSIAGSDLVSVDGSTYESRFRANESETLNNAVHFLGRVSDEELHQLWSRADIVCLPSLYESFGLVHLEAMSHAKPVIAFDIPTTSELIRSDTTGILVESKNVDQLANALSRLATNRELRQRIGFEARRSVEEAFSIQAMASCVEDTYLSLL